VDLFPTARPRKACRHFGAITDVLGEAGCSRTHPELELLFRTVNDSFASMDGVPNTQHRVNALWAKSHWLGIPWSTRRRSLQSSRVCGRLMMACASIRRMDATWASPLLNSLLGKSRSLWKTSPAHLKHRNALTQESHHLATWR
jgi:hypothetical protein